MKQTSPELTFDQLIEQIGTLDISQRTRLEQLRRKIAGLEKQSKPTSKLVAKYQS